MNLLLTALLIFPLLTSPFYLSRENTEVRFSVDSTWHRVKGEAKRVTGKVWLGTPGDISTAQVEVHLPVSSFDTDNSSRDERLREVMAANRFPDVRFTGHLSSEGCPFDALNDNASCVTSLVGTVTIRGVEKPLSFPLRIARQGNQFHFDGDAILEWSAFGVEDPSILIARLDHTVDIHIHVQIPVTS